MTSNFPTAKREIARAVVIAVVIALIVISYGLWAVTPSAIDRKDAEICLTGIPGGDNTLEREKLRLFQLLNCKVRYPFSVSEERILDQQELVLIRQREGMR